MKILTIIGARPQIIKAAALARAFRTHYVGQVEEYILHTGQHYDTLMSDVFFSEMGIPQAACNLGIGSGTHAWQTARMLQAIGEVLEKEKPDGVVVYGDTNSTLAGALAASKMQIPLFHIEAGLRSHFMLMPEEQNRIVADHLANICFAPTQTAMRNLEREGLVDSPAQFTAQRKGRLAVLCGDVMLDNILHYSPLALQSDILQRYSLTPDRYLLATIHRDFNTDTPGQLPRLLQALDNLGKQVDMPVVFPAHPRVAKTVEQWIAECKNSQGNEGSSLRVVPPASYLQMIALEKGAHLILTDSGGVQKEAYFCHTPCIILRHETEWKEIVDQGAAILADNNPELINNAYIHFEHHKPDFAPLFGDGHAAEHIAEQIIRYLD